jgi:hypothetical protein
MQHRFVTYDLNHRFMAYVLYIQKYVQYIEESVKRPKREDVAGGWRRLHNELHNLYASPLLFF